MRFMAHGMQKVLPCAVDHGLSGLQKADGSDSLQSLKSLGRAGPIVSALGISQTVRDNMLPNTPLFDLPGSNWMQTSKLQRLQWGETKRHFKGTNSKEYRTLTPKTPLLGTFALPGSIMRPLSKSHCPGSCQPDCCQG